MSDATSSAAYRDDRAHVFHSWSAQNALTPLVIAGGEGSWIWSEDGTRYLDFSSQLMNVNIGHQHPKMVAAIQEQAGKLCTVAPGMAHDVRSEAARGMLGQSRMSIAQVGAAVGFRDAREFRRAFKRWTGVAPTTLRASALQA